MTTNKTQTTKGYAQTFNINWDWHQSQEGKEILQLQKEIDQGMSIVFYNKCIFCKVVNDTTTAWWINSTKYTDIGKGRIFEWLEKCGYTAHTYNTLRKYNTEVFKDPNNIYIVDTDVFVSQNDYIQGTKYNFIFVNLNEDEEDDFCDALYEHNYRQVKNCILKTRD